MSIADDGCGMAPEVAGEAGSGLVPLGVGILGMRERARELGGELRIDSGSGGTTVSVMLPLETQK